MPFRTSVRHELKGRASTLILAAVALGLPLTAISSAQAGVLPGHGQFVAGHGSIKRGGGKLTIDQNTGTGIIDWNSFSVGKKNGVVFDNGNGATLNRVTGSDLSRIAGSLHATGSVYLINPQGVAVLPTGRVVTTGDFVAAGGSVEDSTLTGRHLHVHGAGQGNVINSGQIVSQTGSVRLLGGNVHNGGAIDAAQATVRAIGGTAAVNGQIHSHNADGSGGAIIVTGHDVRVGSDARISASGAHGGVILIGGDIHGGAIATQNLSDHRIANAATTTVAHGARIAADSAHGAGGSVVLWSQKHTKFDGRLSAHGTHGGFAEISAHRTLAFTGFANLRGAHDGGAGTLLLDPENVVIKNGTSKHIHFSGGTFSPNAANSVLSVAELESELGSANVVVNTGASGTQNGDIAVLNAVTWSNSNMLTLDAAHSIIIRSLITITGAGGLTLTTNDGGSGGDYFFKDGGRVAFTDLDAISNLPLGFLSINGTVYTLEHSIDQLATVISGNAAGHYALADNYNAKSDGNYGTSPIPTAFTGTLEGLGNTISNVKMHFSAAGTGGFFQEVDTGGVVRDIGIEKVDLRAPDTSSVGGLVGLNNGTLQNVHVTGKLFVGIVSSEVGGVAGSNSGVISNSWSSANVTVGDSAPTAYGNSSDVGGFVGNNSGTITNSHATGAVSDTTTSHTGTIDGGTPDAFLGGLVGFVSSGNVSNSYATGNVTGGENDRVGGFAGEIDGAVANAYATGNVFAASGKAGGFAGDNEGTIDSAYAIGMAGLGVLPDGSTNFVGGFVGVDDTTQGSVITNSYWDENTSGIVTDSAGAGNAPSDPGITGVTTADFQAALPTGFSTSDWKIVAGTSFAYLTWQFPKGVPQVVSGSVLKANGIAPLAGAVVHLLANGTTRNSALTGGSVTSYADGYYYYLLDPGSIGKKSSVLAYGTGTTGAAFRDHVSGSLTGLDIQANNFSETTAVTASSVLTAHLKSAVGHTKNVNKIVNKLANLSIIASASKFGIDSAITRTGSVTIDAAGSLSESGRGAITAMTFGGTSGKSVTLKGHKNVIAKLGDFAVASGAFSLTDNRTLQVTGTVDDAPGTLTLQTTTGNIAISGKLRGDTVTLISAGRATEAKKGIIVARLLNVTAETGIKLTSSNNKIKKIGTRTTAKGPNQIKK